MGRLFRIFRIVRLLEISDHLKEVEKRIVSIVPTVFSFAILLLILTYIYSIMGMFMFDKKVFASSDFSSIRSSFVTLFQVMTLDNWSDVMKDLRANVTAFPAFVIEMYFVSFVILTAIIAFNVFIAVMTSQVQEKLEKDIEEKISGASRSATSNQLTADMQLLMDEIKSLRGEVRQLSNQRE
ncbi:MAG: ion transporter [Cyclobacteriaceae bacterium]